MRTIVKTGLAAAAIATGFLAGSLGVGSGAQAASSAHPVVSASTGVTAKAAGRTGWQGKFTYSLPAGSGGVFFHYSCPSGLVARSGGWSANAVGQPGVHIVAESPRQDQNYTEYYWTLLWPGGAPAGVTIDFDAFCTKAPI